MNYEFLFWDIDGTLFNGELSSRHNFVTYDGLPELLAEVPVDRQGIISNNYPEIQMEKLEMMGILHCFNPELIFTSVGEARKILQDQDNPVYRRELAPRIARTPEWDIGIDIENATISLASSRFTVGALTQKPEPYMYERLLEKTGADPATCLAIGDENADIIGARGVGMDALLWLPTYHEEVMRRIHSSHDHTYRLDAGDIDGLRQILF